MALKYSRQREVIKDFLCTRKDHPTADVVYMNVRQKYPNISLGTVYRNLTLLSEIGEIRRLRVGDGVDLFDPLKNKKKNFICSHCGRIIDLKMENIDYIQETAEKDFNGRIDSYSAYFFGLCESCCNLLQS